MTDETSPELPLIRKYFSELSDEQHGLLERFADGLRDWNSRVNLVSRKDIDNLEERHLLHSLSVARIWEPGVRISVADVGTGGGLPGVPLAILFPDCRFTLVDFVGKKAAAVADLVRRLKLKNVRVIADRAENLNPNFDVVLGRAVSKLPPFLDCTLPLLKPAGEGDQIGGVYYFKGTHYREELAEHPVQPANIWELSQFFAEPYFVEKFLLRFTV